VVTERSKFPRWGLSCTAYGAAASSLMPDMTFAVLNGACVIGLGAQQFPSLKGLIDGHLQFSY
jgi:hypothetical protein